MNIEEYLDKLTEQIRYKKARAAIREEVRGHLEDQMEAYLADGLDRKEAEERSVLEMGDPVEAGGELDQIHRPKMAWGTIAVVGILGTAGLVIQYLLQDQFAEAVWMKINFGRQLFYLILSFGVMLGVCWLDYSRIGRYAKAIYSGLVILLLMSSLLGAVPVNGGRQWISLPFGLWLNTAMALFLFVPLYAAVLYTYRGQGYLALLKAILWAAPVLFTGMLSGSGPHTATLLFLAFAVVLAVAVWKGWFQISKKRALFLIGGSVILFPAAWIGFLVLTGSPYSQYLTARLAAYTGTAEMEGTLYLTMMLRRIVENSRLIGAAYGGTQDWMTGVSNYTLTYIIACYGILAGALLTGILVLLFLHFARISLGQKNQMGMLMGVGCSVVFLLQLVLYVLENLGLVLPCGSYCPFLTYGGSGMMVTYMLIGLMLSIYRYEDVFPEENSHDRVKIYN